MTNTFKPSSARTTVLNANDARVAFWQSYNNTNLSEKRRNTFHLFMIYSDTTCDLRNDFHPYNTSYLTQKETDDWTEDYTFLTMDFAKARQKMEYDFTAINLTDLMK